MEKQIMTELSYYPGCSLASTARENNESLIYLFKHLGFDLLELGDWNYCGSSSAHSVNTDIAFDLANRNLSLAPPGRPLLVVGINRIVLSLVAACYILLQFSNCKFLIDDDLLDHIPKSYDAH